MTLSAKKPHVSKNKKRNWRKYSNVDEVEEYLEEERFNERVGGAVSEKADDALYFIEEEEKKDSPKCIKPAKKIILEDLKCFSAIKSTSQVSVPIQPNFVQNKVKPRVTLKKQAKAVNRKQKQRKKEKVDTSIEFYDIWSNNAEEKSSNKPELDQDLLNYTNEMTKTRPPKVPVHRYQKPSLLPAVEVPLPGASYNPDFSDHQDLLIEAMKVEQQYEKEYNKIERSLTEMFPTADEAPTEETWLAEMSQGLGEDNNQQEVNISETQEEMAVVKPPVLVDKKTRQKRNKEKEQKKKIKENIRKKLENKRLNEVYRLRSIKKELNRLEAISEKRKKEKDKKLIAKLYQPLVLSKHKYESPLPEFNLSEELTGELRTVKVEGNILEDRYKSFQRRNMIEPRIRQKMKRKYKLKILEKRSHREFQ